MRPLRKGDLDAVLRRWNTFHPARYRIDADLLRLNAFESPLLDMEASWVEEAGGVAVGFALVKRSAAPDLYVGPDPQTAHLSGLEFSEPSVGAALVSAVVESLRDQGRQRLVFGTDSRHFFPGCPADFEALAGFLAAERFVQTGESYDLERDLAGYLPPQPPPDLTDLRPLMERDVDELHAFLNVEFPGRWLYDVMTKLRLDGPECVYGIFLEGGLGGFALIQNWTHRVPIGGAVWRADLGERWGSLGPIGVAKGLRGRRLGHSLLGGALAHLRERGVRRCIIDWTGLVDFYGAHGFRVSRTYQHLVLPLE